jgi:hypothetical protein
MGMAAKIGGDRNHGNGLSAWRARCIFRAHSTEAAGMGYRRFTDRDGATWEVRDVSRSEWEFVPTSAAAGRSVRVRAPSYESDPFEMSTEECQRLLDSEQRGGTAKRKSPFLD